MLRLKPCMLPQCSLCTFVDRPRYAQPCRGCCNAVSPTFNSRLPLNAPSTQTPSRSFSISNLTSCMLSACRSTCLCVCAANQRQPWPQLPQMHPPFPNVRAFEPDPRRERVQSICESIVAGYFDSVSLLLLCSLFCCHKMSLKIFLFLPPCFLLPLVGVMKFLTLPSSCLLASLLYKLAVFALYGLWVLLHALLQHAFNVDTLA